MISVIIPTFKRQAKLKNLLASLERQVTSIPFEVIVIANLPEVGLKKVVESYGTKFRFHETGRIGVNIARNKGLDLARGTVALFLDDDIYVGDNDLLERHFVAHERHPEACAIGGPYLPKTSISTVESAYHWITQHALTSRVLERGEATRLAGGNVSFKLQSLEGFRFDDRILFGSSEAPLFSQLRRAQNLFLMNESLAVEHRASVSFFDLAKRAFYQGYGTGLVSAMQMPERPHWSVPLEETLRRAHVNETRLFRLAVRVYRRFYAHGLKLGTQDSDTYVASGLSKKIEYRRPDFSPLKMAAAFFGGRWRKAFVQDLRTQSISLQSATRTFAR